MRRLTFGRTTERAQRYDACKGITVMCPQSWYYRHNGLEHSNAGQRDHELDAVLVSGHCDLVQCITVLRIGRLYPERGVNPDINGIDKNPVAVVS